MMKISLKQQPIVLTLLLFGLCACSAKDQAEQQEQAQVAEDSAVIATINGDPIFENDLNRAKDRWVGNLPPHIVDAQVNEKILDSLLRSKAMAVTMQDQLTTAESQEIDDMVAAYREDLLVRKYVEKHGNLQEITAQQIKDYYQKNTHLFGGGVQTEIETITVVETADEQQKQKLLTELNKLKENRDWKARANQLKQQGYRLSYKHTKVNPALLMSPLKELALNTKQSDGAKLTTNKPITLLRVLDEQKIPPKPLAQVSDQIRKDLQRRQLRERIETLSNDVMAKVTVARH